MNALFWAQASEKQMVQHTRAQDAKFQAAMRHELRLRAEEMGLRLVPKEPPAPEPRQRDYINIRPSITPQPDPMHWRWIISEVCRKYNVTKLDIYSDRRPRRVVDARLETYWRMRHETTLSYPEIGRRLHKDHSTVILGVRRYEQRLAAGEVA